MPRAGLLTHPACRSDLAGLLGMPRADSSVCLACLPNRADLQQLPKADLPASLPALPAALTELSCDGCTGLTSLPPPPPARRPDAAALLGLSRAGLLTNLVCGDWTALPYALPDACPPALVGLNGYPVDRHGGMHV